MIFPASEASEAPSAWEFLKASGSVWQRLGALRGVLRKHGQRKICCALLVEGSMEERPRGVWRKDLGFIIVFRGDYEKSWLK